MAKYFDAHAHAHFPAYGDEAADVVQRALDADVEMILVGTERGTSAGAIALAERFADGVWAAVGLHPTHTTAKEYVDAGEMGDAAHAREPEAFDADAYRKLAAHPKVVAIGECGLDYYRLDPETARIQQEALTQQLDLAQEVGKPVTIHCRNAFADLVALLEVRRATLPERPGTVHFFTGTQEDARRLLDLGFFLQFGGVITFAKMYENLVRYVPLERIITETDAPYVAPTPYRGRRSEPAYVTEVARKVAELKGVPLEEVRETVRKNAQEVFRI